MKEYPAVQARLWNKLQNRKFEERAAKSDLPSDEVLRLLQYGVYFDLLNIPMPVKVEDILHFLEEDGVIIKQDNGLYAITNLGAVLFAKKFTEFPSVSRKAARVVQYEGKNRYTMMKEDISDGGYAVIFEEMMKYIHGLLPSKEIIKDGVRIAQLQFPTLAIRELIANALIHQDFFITGTGPVVEIFDNRIEVTNPGSPLVDVFRIIDTPPKSRNEKLSSLMRRMGICEELGTGWDKIVISCEMEQLPAPKMETYEESTKVTLYARADFSSLTIDERLWACYLHSCIRFLQGEFLTNRSLRERFGLKDSSSGMVSRIIKEAVAKKLIRPFDPDTAPRYMKYVPIWG